MNRLFFGLLLTLGLQGSHAQELKTTTKKTLQTIEEFQVFKSDRKIRHGNYLKKTFYGRLIAKGQFKNNVESGIWEFYDYRNGDLEQTFDYEKRKFVYLKTEHTPLNHFNYHGQWMMEKLDTVPVPIGGLSNLKLELVEKAYSYRTAHHHFPKAGVALFSFIVTKTGEVKEFKVAQTSGNSFESQLLAVIENSNGRWIPGKFKGEPVDTELYIPMAVRYKTDTPTEKEYVIEFNYPIHN